MIGLLKLEMGRFEKYFATKLLNQVGCFLKKARYVLSFILFSLVLVFTGELFISYLNNFGTQFFETSMYMQAGLTKQEMTADIEVAAEKTGVDVFVIERVHHDALTETMNFYGTAGTENYLKRAYGLKDKFYQSAFWGNVEIQYRPISELDVTKHKNYLIHGTWRQAENFKLLLIDKYAGNHVKNEEGYSIDENDCFILIWSIIIGIIWLTTAYEVILWRRELIIRVTLGERISCMVLKRLGCELLIQGGMFFLLQYIFSFLTNTYYNFPVTLLAFLVMSIGITLIYLSLFLCDYRKVLSQRMKGRNLLKVGYVFQVISIVMVLMIASVETGLICTGIEFQKQQVFFETYQDYSYASICETWDERSKEDNTNKICKKFYEKFEKIVLEDVSDYVSSSETYIFANEGAVDYLKSEIPELVNYKWEKKVYFICPESESGKEEVISNTQGVAMSYMDYYKTHELITYKQGSVLCFTNHTERRSAYAQNPVIVLDMTGKKGKLENFNSFCIENALFKITKDEFEQYVRGENLDEDYSRLTNIWSYYKYQKNSVMKTAGIAAVLLAIVLFLESIVIRNVIRMEYEVNAMEKALMKILGYTFFRRNRKQYAITLGTIFVMTGVILVVGLIYQLAMLWTLVLICWLLGGINLIFQFVFTHRIEQEKISKILKGGSL